MPNLHPSSQSKIVFILKEVFSTRKPEITLKLLVHNHANHIPLEDVSIGDYSVEFTGEYEMKNLKLSIYGIKMRVTF